AMRRRQLLGGHRNSSAFAVPACAALRERRIERIMIAHTIQLALAPVFLLVAIGNIMNILPQRLGRIVHRSRLPPEKPRQTSGEEHDMVVREMRFVDRRIAMVGRAILLLVISGITVGVVVAMLFLGEFLELNLQRAAGAAFLFAIGLLMGALLLFF